MFATWIESAAKGRHGGPVRAGMWSAVVVGTHPIEAGQEVWLELEADEVSIGPLPAYWIENKGVNSLWHVPIPPQAVGARLHYRSAARRLGGEAVFSPHQDAMVRPNLPDRTEAPDIVGFQSEGLVGNRMMTVRVDGRGSTQDVYFPTAGLHSDVRPAEGDLPQSRAHFRAIVGGLALGHRLDWFNERLSWRVFQHYQGATNVLLTELNWCEGPIRVLATDFVASGDVLPRTAGETESPGQYIKRFRVINEGDKAYQGMFAVYVHAEVNGGVGETGLSWHDADRTLLATNRGHSHANRKLARDATVEFAIALDDRGPVHCEPTGVSEAILLRRINLPARGSVAVDLLVSGAYTGWRGDNGTFEHWLRPALHWFRSTDLNLVEACTAQDWDAYVEPLPSPHFPKATYAVSLRRSALAAGLHADLRWGAIASGFDRGLSAYCWPRDAVWTGMALERAGHGEINRGVYRWLGRVRGQNRPYAYWYQKYTIDGWPEWETPAVDQTAIIPFGLERHYRRTGDLAFLASSWPVVEQAAAVCGGQSGHPGLRRLDDLRLITSAGLWDNRYGAFLYSNAAVVAGLRSAARIARTLQKDTEADRWQDLADLIWNEGILQVPENEGPGLINPSSDRFYDCRRLSTLPGLWSDRPEYVVDRTSASDISLLGPAIPFGLLPASDLRIRRGADVILRANVTSADPNLLARLSMEQVNADRSTLTPEVYSQDASCLATLWMSRYLIQLGRETGQGAHWLRALAMLDAILTRLGPLGLSMRPTVRGADMNRSGVGSTLGAWGLHGMLIDTMLDFAGLEYDAVDHRLTLDPALPAPWPHIGLAQSFPCGSVSYRLDRPIGGEVYRLTVTTDLLHPTRLAINLTCPGLGELGPWQSRPESPPPRFDRTIGRLSWDVELPIGPSTREWTWG